MRIIIALIRKDLEQQWRMYVLSFLAFLAMLLIFGFNLEPGQAERYTHMVISMSIYFTVGVAGFTIFEERQRKTISVLRALPISDSTIVAAKFLVQLGTVLLAFLLLYFGSIFLIEQLRGLRLGVSLEALAVAATVILLLNALLVFCGLVFDSKIAWVMPVIGLLVAIIAIAGLQKWLQASRGIDLYILLLQWAERLYAYHLIPVIGMFLIMAIYKLTVALLGRKETVELTS